MLLLLHLTIQAHKALVQLMARAMLLNVAIACYIVHVQNMAVYMPSSP
jgi:hypothetical protein